MIHCCHTGQMSLKILLLLYLSGLIFVLCCNPSDGHAGWVDSSQHHSPRGSVEVESPHFQCRQLRADPHTQPGWVIWTAIKRHLLLIRQGEDGLINRHQSTRIILIKAFGQNHQHLSLCNASLSWMSLDCFRCKLWITFYKSAFYLMLPFVGVMFVCREVLINLGCEKHCTTTYQIIIDNSSLHNDLL